MFKLEKPSLSVLKVLLDDACGFVLPPEVIKEHGDGDWRNMVGTGPYEMYAHGSNLISLESVGNVPISLARPSGRAHYGSLDDLDPSSDGASIVSLVG